MKLLLAAALAIGATRGTASQLVDPSPCEALPREALEQRAQESLLQLLASESGQPVEALRARFEGDPSEYTMDVTGQCGSLALIYGPTRYAPGDGRLFKLADDGSIESERIHILERMHRKRLADIAGKVEQLAALLTDGYAELFEQEDNVRFGPLLPGEGHAAVAVFSIEGFRKSNSHNQYLAVFAHVVNETGELDDPHEPYRLLDVMQIGGKGWRSFLKAPLTIQPGLITLEGLNYAASDALCCPSLPFRTRFRFEDGRLQEVVSDLATTPPEFDLWLKQGWQSARDQNDCIDREFWTPRLRALKPLRVCSHRANIAVTTSDLQGCESGLYLINPASSWMPVNSSTETFQVEQASGNLRFQFCPGE